ncbi:MAG TPA: DUF4340 domain-containing protein [Polyangiaceae bacterium]
MNKAVRRQVVNIALAVIAVVLVVAVLLTSGGVTTSEQSARENNVLAAYREDDIRKLVIEREGKRIVLERAATDGGEEAFLITEPVKEEADAYAIRKLLGSLEFATAVRRIKPDEVNRGAFGLEAPRMVFSIDMGPVQYRLLLGKEAASPSGASYLEITGESAPRKGVVIVSKELVSELSVDVGQLRGQEMMPYLSASLKTLTVDGAGGTRRLRQDEWGWRFDGMLADRRVNREALNRILLQFARTKAERFIDAKLAEKALSSGEQVTIRMVPKNTALPPGRIVIGGKCPNGEGIVALRHEPDVAAACVPSSVMPGLATPTGELVDRNLFGVRRDEVESIAIRIGERRLELDRKGDGFVMRAPAKGDVDMEAGNQRLDAMLGLTGEPLDHIPDAAELAKLGLSPPAGEVTFKSVAEHGSSKLKEETVQLGHPRPDGTTYVRRKHDGAVLSLPRDALTPLLPDATLVRSRQILQFDDRSLERFQIVAPGREQSLTKNPTGGYILDAPKGFTGDPNLISDLVDALASLTTDRWVSDTNDGHYGLQPPKLEVRLTLSSTGAGTGQRTLRVGDPTSGGAYAVLEGTQGVFVLPKRVLDLLETPLVDRSAFVIDPGITQSIRLEHKGATITLQLQSGSFVETGPQPRLSKGQIAQIIDALASMRAEAAVHVGAVRPNEGFQNPELVVTAESAPGGGEAIQKLKYRIGAGDAWRAVSVFYARADGVDATFVIARGKVNQVLDAL